MFGQTQQVQTKYVVRRSFVKDTFHSCSHNNTPWLSVDENKMQSKGKKGEKIQKIILVRFSQQTTSSSWSINKVQLGKLLMRITLWVFFGLVEIFGWALEYFSLKSVLVDPLSILYLSHSWLTQLFFAPNHSWLYEYSLRSQPLLVDAVKEYSLGY